MRNSHPLRARCELDGPWWVKRESDLEDSSLPRRIAGPIGGDWRVVPPRVHLQPWLFPDNPHWGAQVREVNDAAWWYRTRFDVAERMRGERLRLVFGAVDYYYRSRHHMSLN